MAELLLQNVTKIFSGGIIAVKDFTLNVKDGEFIVIVGPSGCGKSTMLRLIAGLEELTAGNIYIDGKLVNDLPPRNRDIAMVFQNYALYPHMTVRENLAFALKLRKLPKSEIEQRIKEAASILELTEVLDRRPKALSGGQCQRVAVGRAIVRKPKVFLFDEPLSNLDAKLRVQMRVEIKRLHSKLNVTIIYVTHDQTEAMTMGDRIVVMHKGTIMQVGTPIELYDKPVSKFVAGFIGTPPMNFFKGTIELSKDTLFFKSDSGFILPIPPEKREKLEPYINKPTILGLRPEDIGAPVSDEQKNIPVIPGIVDVVEPMGYETYVYYRHNQDSFISRVDPHLNFTVGEKLKPVVYMAKAHFFDFFTEKRIV